MRIIATSPILVKCCVKINKLRFLNVCMTKEQEFILQLVRNAVCPSAQIAISTDDINWRKVMDFAMEQGVLGVAFETVERLKAPSVSSEHSLLSNLPMEVLIKWFVTVEYWKNLYKEHKKAVAELAEFYTGCCISSKEGIEGGIKMMLMKGYGLSLYWPIPEHRPVGDIDIYNFGLWQFADQMVEQRLGINVDEGHEHHTCFTYKGVLVENHYDFVNTKVNESSRELERLYKELANKDCRELKVGVEGTESTIYLPSATLNALFLIRHLGQHFAGAEATLRQVLDWGFFMQHEAMRVDWDMVIPAMKRAGIYQFFVHVNEICLDYLGFEVFDIPEEYRGKVDKVLEVRILEDMLQPEFADNKPIGNTMQVVWFKLRRFFANRWKRKLVFRESICNQMWYGSIAHLKRFNTIKD